MPCGTLGFVILAITFQAIQASPEVHEATIPGPNEGIDHMKQFGLNLLTLGLTPQQSLGVMSSLFSTGLLNPNTIRNPTRPVPVPPQPPASNIFQAAASNSNLFNAQHQIDPYFLSLLSHYSKYLPYGLGAQGIYGSSGLPKAKPLGVFKYNDKN